MEGQHYATLGLEKGASKEEIKKAYRTLSMQYHPDKVRHLGDEFRAVAENKMKEINAAYDYFKKQQMAS
jgi:DnaJ like chaperone protein